MSAAKDPYQVLGVSRSTSQADIRRAYSTIAKQHHPDRNPGNAAALERFVEATEAYETLSDPVRRTAADATLKRVRDVEAMEFDTWGAPRWGSDPAPDMPPSATSARYTSLGEDPWSEPPYGAIAAVIALVGIAVLVLVAFIFM